MVTSVGLEPWPPSLVGMQNGKAVDQPGVSEEAGQTYDDPGRLRPGSPPKRQEDVRPHKRLYAGARGRTIRKTQVETTKYLLTEKWKQQNGVRPYNRIFSISPQKGMKLWHPLSRGWTLRTLHLVTEARCKNYTIPLV